MRPKSEHPLLKYLWLREYNQVLARAFLVALGEFQMSQVKKEKRSADEKRS